MRAEAAPIGFDNERDKPYAVFVALSGSVEVAAFEVFICTVKGR